MVSPDPCVPPTRGVRLGFLDAPFVLPTKSAVPAMGMMHASRRTMQTPSEVGRSILTNFCLEVLFVCVRTPISSRLGHVPCAHRPDRGDTACRFFEAD